MTQPHKPNVWSDPPAANEIPARTVRRLSSYPHQASLPVAALVAAATIALCALLWANTAIAQQAPAADLPSPVLPDGDIFTCPFDALRTAYEGVLTDKSLLNVKAVESEVLMLCTERQRILNSILNNERNLRSLLDGLSDQAPPPIAADINTQPVIPVDLDDLPGKVISVIAKDGPTISAAEQDAPPAATPAPVAAAPVTCGSVLFLGQADGPSGAKGYAVIQKIGPDIRPLRTGEALPCGETVTKITPTELTLAGADEPRRIARSTGDASTLDAPIFRWRDAGSADLPRVPNQDTDAPFSALPDDGGAARFGQLPKGVADFWAQSGPSGDR